MKRLVALLAIVLFLSSCSKEPGEGGNSMVKGRVIERRYIIYPSNYTERALTDEDVFICYGDDDNTVDDRVRTSFDGSFKFGELRKGKYRIFVYSEDTTAGNRGNPVTVINDVEITANRSVKDLGDIRVFNF
jgi:hypothetical protein